LHFAGTCSQARSYERHRPEETVLHQVFVQHLPEFLAEADDQGGLPKFVRRELEGFMRCGLLVWLCPCGLPQVRLRKTCRLVV